MLFELDGVTKTYGEITALDDLSVSMPEGAIGLLGPNGAGKTTMIRTLLGLIKIDKGGGEVLGRDIRKKPLDVRQSAGFMPEDDCLFPGMEGVELAAYAGELAGMPVRSAMQRAHEVLDYVGLGEARYRQVESYSTGMRQRVKLAAAIVHDPKFLILDEPTNGLDPAGRTEILELARDLARNKGMSILFSSHLLPDVEFVCDHVMVLGRGRLLASGLIAELTKSRGSLFEVRLKDGDDRFAAVLRGAGCEVDSVEDLLVVQLLDGQDGQFLWEKAKEAGVQVRHLRPRERSLEDVFLRSLEGQS